MKINAIEKNTIATACLAFLLALACQLFSMTAAHAYDLDACAAERFGSDLTCTSGDVSITGIVVAPGSPTSCVAGDTVLLDLDVTVNFNQPDRYDIGIFFSHDGKSPALYPEALGGEGADSCSVASLPTPSDPRLPTDQFDNYDQDSCGDGGPNLGGITGNNSGVLSMPSVPVTCQAVPLSGGRLFIPFVTSWNQNSRTVCTDGNDVVPGNKAKCNVPDSDNSVEVLSSTVSLVVLPDITKTPAVGSLTAGDSTYYDVVIKNTTGAPLSNAIFRDPAVQNLTVDSLTCSAAGGASCPSSLSIQTLQAGGLVLPSMPVDSSLTFTLAATVNPDAPAGTLTNTAYVVVDGESNSDDAEITVYTRLGVSKSFSPTSIAVGAESTLTITLENTNLSEAAEVGFTDTYPANLVNASTPAASTTCADGTVSATAGGNTLSLNGGAIPAGSSCTVTVQVTSSSQGTYTNSIDADSIGNAQDYKSTAASAALAVGTSNLSTSTKSVEDMNGGEPDPGDTLEYTITLTNTAATAATGVSISDTISSDLNPITSVTTCPSGAACTITDQELTATGITVPANDSVTLVFRATIASGTAPGTLIANCADISNPAGVGASPCASTVTVSPSSVAASGSKPLYLYSDSTLSRNIATSQSSVSIAQGGSQTWTLSPALVKDVTISPDMTTLSIIPLQLYLSSDAASASRTVQAGLACSSGGTTYSETKIFDGTAVNNAYLSSDTTSPSLVIFNNLTIATDHTCPAGATWNLTVSNNSSSGGVRVHPTSGGGNSYVTLPSRDVINVDSVNIYDAAYSATTSPSSGYFAGGQTAYIRAVVSDPFGDYDITSTTITIEKPNGTEVVTGVTMSEVVESPDDDATKTYEYAYTLPTSDAGTWTAIITAHEGREGTVTDAGKGYFNLGLPDITLVKMVQTFSDPVHGETNPYSIPGAVMRYTILSTNHGFGSADVDSVTLSDQIPAQTDLVVSGSPVVFIDGVVSSGLTFNGAADVVYKDASDTQISPSTDGNGVDPAVRKIIVNPKSTFLASDGTNNPSFSIVFYVRVR